MTYSLGHTQSPTAEELYRRHEQSILKHTDRLFAGLMSVQWIAAIAAAYWIAPKAWTGTTSYPHLHVSAAIYLGGAISLFPIALALLRPGQTSTRHVIATAQMLMSSLLIHLTGGRIETHFHVFGSLAFLSFYRDWRVLIPATAVVAADHFVRGVFWPQSVFGVMAASQWRWLEHAGWVVFEDIFLIGACRRAHREMRSIAERTADLRASEARYRAVLDRAEGIFLADAESMRLRECNAAFRNLLGVDEERAASMAIGDFDAGDPGELQRAVQKLLAGKVPIQVDRRYRRSDGSIIDVTLNLSALGEGAEDVLCGAVRDVTEHKRAEKELAESEAQLRQVQKMEAVGQLAGGIAHDFNNLLTGILGYGELVMQQLDKNDPARSDVAEIVRAGQSAAGLTRQLLTFSRREVVQRKVLDLNAVLTNVHKMLERLIGEQITLTLILDPDLGHVTADAGQLEQVIVNLAVNARDAMVDGGVLRLQTANVTLTGPEARQYALEAGSYVMLHVSDTGCGMDDAIRTRVFEPFFTTKDPGKGTGLGLSTVYGIVKQSGGSIEVESAPGQGSTFRLLLPAVTRPLQCAATAPAPAICSHATETILLVEDDSIVRGLARRTLQAAGYVVLEAGSPGEALRLASRHAGAIHLILTDVVMPDISGPVLADRLTAERPDARVLFMSGYTADALAMHRLEERGVAFLAKPFTPTALTRRVREVLDAPAAAEPALAATHMTCRQNLPHE